MAGKKFRFGLVGCGRISGKHVEAIAHFCKEAELAAVCDIRTDKAEAKADEYVELMRKNKTGYEIKRPDIYSDIDKMLESPDMDVVAISTPSGLHPVHGIKSAIRGKHVISEKPMATNMQMANELIKACDTAKVHLFVVLQNRLNPTMQLLKRAVDKGRFGRIYMILINVLWCRPQSYYDQAEWRGTWEFDGGAMMNQASHYFDSLVWLGGPVESVTAITSTLARKIETEDTGSVIMKFRNGAIGNLNVTMLTYQRNYEGSITVIGERGTAKIGGMALNKIEHWEFSDQDEDDLLADSINYDPPDVYGFGHTGYYRNVLDVLRHKENPDTDGREGKKSLEVILGAYKSSREGKTIHLPLDLY